MTTPDFVITGEDLRGSCIAEGENRPRVMMRDDKCQYKLEYLHVDEGNLNRGKVEFLVKNVSATCTYKNCPCHG